MSLAHCQLEMELEMEPEILRVVVTQMELEM